MMHHRLILLFILFLATSFQVFAQGACEVHSGPAAFENNTINGSVITNPSGTINITNNYSTPTDNLGYTNELLALMRRLYEDPNFRKLSPNQQARFLTKEEQKIKQARLKLEKERLGIAVQKKNLADAKEGFKKEIEKQRKEFEKIIAAVPTNSSNIVINERIQELKTKGENIIESANNCMINDFELVSIQEVNTGEIIYGFALDEIRNDPNYVMIDDYQEGMARVKRANKFGFYNAKGELAIDFKYDEALRFENGVSLIQNLGEWFFIDKKGNRTYSFDQDTKNITRFKKGNYILEESGICLFFGCFWMVNDKGEILTEKYFLMKPYLNNLDWVIVSKKINQGEGILSLSKNKMVIPFGYEDIKPFNKNLIIVQSSRKHDERRYGVINISNKLIVPYFYREINPMGKLDLAICKKNDEEFGIINGKGKLVLPVEYTGIASFDQNNFAKVFKNKKVGLINSKGKLIIDCIYSDIDSFDKNGLAKVENVRRGFRRVGLINKNGLEIVPVIFEDIESDIKNVRFIIKKTLKYRLKSGAERFTVNKSGKCISSNADIYRKLVREYYKNKKSK